MYDYERCFVAYMSEYTIFTCINMAVSCETKANMRTMLS
jgi:hypothetical protein